MGAVTTAPGTYGFAALFLLSGAMELAVWTQVAREKVDDWMMIAGWLLVVCFLVIGCSLLVCFLLVCLCSLSFVFLLFVCVCLFFILVVVRSLLIPIVVVLLVACWLHVEPNQNLGGGFRK